MSPYLIGMFDWSVYLHVGQDTIYTSTFLAPIYMSQHRKCTVCKITNNNQTNIRGIPCSYHHNTVDSIESR